MAVNPALHPPQAPPRRGTGTLCATLLGCRLLPLAGVVLLIGACVSTAEVMFSERVPTPVQRLVLLILVAVVLVATLALYCTQTCGAQWTVLSPMDSIGAWVPPDSSSLPQLLPPPSRARLRPLPQMPIPPQSFPFGDNRTHAAALHSPPSVPSSLSAAAAFPSNPVAVSLMPSVLSTPLPPTNGLST